MLQNSFPVVFDLLLTTSILKVCPIRTSVSFVSRAFINNYIICTIFNFHYFISNINFHNIFSFLLLKNSKLITEPFKCKAFGVLSIFNCQDTLQRKYNILFLNCKYILNFLPCDYQEYTTLINCNLYKIKTILITLTVLYYIKNYKQFKIY